MTENYTIAELFEMAKTDDSWESDPELREKLADMFLTLLVFSF